MNSSLLFFLFLFSLLPLAIAVGPPMIPGVQSKMDCIPTSCGHVENITYPFWVDGQQPSYCGFPSFKLSCKNQTLLLQMSADSYIVCDIIYQNQSIVLANAGFVNSSCPVLKYSNMSFALTPFNISSVNRGLVLSLGCSAMSNYYKIPCDVGYPGNDGAFAYLGGDYYHVGSVSNYCKSAVILPVVDYSRDAGVEDFTRLLSNGFLVEWTVASCEASCTESKGFYFDYVAKKKN